LAVVGIDGLLGDEGKPICQNCISKGFECRYAAAYQILGRNNFTPEVVSDVTYTKLKVCIIALYI
jgi:hypothetical protein